jgi:alpha-glucan,water dikinase
VRIKIQRPQFTSFAVSLDGFNPRIVGGKSNNLKKYQHKLPEWMVFPISVALPFMVFERVLSERNNEEIARTYGQLTGEIDKVIEGERAGLLATIRQSIQGLHAPDELKSSLRKVMQDGGLALPIGWESAWGCITTVWASKWNDRAYWSRVAMGIPHENLVMAVLIQQVVESDYAFVIHTVNPVTGDGGELYAEVVPGLGETLVGNYPGRALSFVCRKGKKGPVVMGFPSKSEALYGKGLIFRSDSNGEDLAQYAGAGLYDSAMFPSPHRVSMDYSNEPLFWNEGFRQSLLQNISLIGETIERVAGVPQDIEGSYSKGRYYIVQTRPQVGIISE